MNLLRQIVTLGTSVEVTNYHLWISFPLPFNHFALLTFCITRHNRKTSRKDVYGLRQNMIYWYVLPFSPRRIIFDLFNPIQQL